MPKHLPREPIGTIIGNFTLLEYVGVPEGRPKTHGPYAKVRCSCGVEKVVSWKAVRSGATKSCGHLGKSDSKYKTNDENGNSKVFYTRWANLKSRFTRKNTKQYKEYEEHGVTLDWNNYKEFYDDMNESFCSLAKQQDEKDIVLYRHDNTKSFNKDNCYWGTKKVVYPIIIEGRKFNTTKQISEEFNVPESRVISRLYVLGYKGRKLVD